jgi:alpha-tubulin suppressor-like RCC1 family protein
MRRRHIPLLITLLLACENITGSDDDPLTFTAVDAGSSHTCGITTTGAAFCWGYNFQGELGRTSVDVCGAGMPAPCGTRPGPVSGNLRFLRLSAGSSHTCGITTDSTAFCWGANFNGQLGTGAADGLPHAPTLVTGGFKWKSLDAGVAHTCGVTTTGAAFCWGDGGQGQLGDGSSTPHFVANPTAVVGGLTFVAIVAGGRQSCAVTSTGTAYCWGETTGNDTFPLSAAPRVVSGGHSFASLSAQWLHMCGVATTATAYCWGQGFLGVLGDSGLSTGATPSRVVGGLTFSGVSVGSQHTCGVTIGGAGYCWGQTDFGQLGNGVSGATPDESAPVAVSGGLTFASITSGGVFSCGLTTVGVAYCWGENEGGMLGDGTKVSKNVPVPVARQSFFELSPR